MPADSTNSTSTPAPDLPPWKKNLPMQLTLSRVYAVPIIILLLHQSRFFFSILAAFLFIISSITDYFDGYFARKWNLVSNLGKFMDPVTDKILVLGILIFLTHQGFIDPYVVILLTIRDTFIGGIRAAASADQLIIDAKSSGKWKTGLQMGAIPAIILGMSYKNQYEIEILVDLFKWVGQFGYGLLWASSLLSVVSALQYYNIYKNHGVNTRRLVKK